MTGCNSNPTHRVGNRICLEYCHTYLTSPQAAPDFGDLEKESCRLFQKNMKHVEYLSNPPDLPNLVEFQILLVESPIGVSTGRKANRGDLGIALGSEIQ